MLKTVTVFLKSLKLYSKRSWYTVVNIYCVEMLFQIVVKKNSRFRYLSIIALLACLRMVIFKL